MRIPLLANRGMAAKIVQTARKALELFSADPVPQDKLQDLVNLASQLTAKDLNFNVERARRSRVFGAPASYMEIFVSKALTVCVFVLWDGYKMPMHNHPKMHGILKVIHGTVKVQSYTPSQLNNNNNGVLCENTDFRWMLDKVSQAYPKERNLILARKHEPLILTAGENVSPAVLFPDDCNIHEVQAVGGVAAFLDILAPSYTDNGIDYFEEVLNVTPDRKEPYVCLKAVLPDANLVHDRADYRGPPVRL